MADFLTLCNDVASQSGTVAGSATIIDVTQVSGRLAKVVRWTQKAWTWIQNARDDWDWMTSEFTKTLIIGQGRYSPTDFALPRVAKWAGDTDDYQPMTIYDPAKGVADETALRQISYDVWRTAYGRGVQVNQRPSDYAIGRDGALYLGPLPDKAYTLKGEYRRTPQTLSVNGDVPELPVKHHDIIVERALRFMAEDDEGVFAANAAGVNYSKMFRDLVNEQTGRLT